MVPERHNNVKVLLLMDVGGTMDDHIQRVEELFSAVKAEFKHLEFYYFHNCVYDFMWKNNRRRFAENFPPGTSSASTTKTTNSFRGRCHHEPLRNFATRRQRGVQQRGSRGQNGCNASMHAFPKFAWINPDRGMWQYRQSISIIQQTHERPHKIRSPQRAGRHHAHAVQITDTQVPRLPGYALSQHPPTTAVAG